jgi:putative serine protease PepD
MNNTITFTYGTGYAATLLGSDEYSDLAVLAIDSQSNNLEPLRIVDSSSLKVGHPISVGSPNVLEGSVTTGIVSALCRTITEDLSGGVTIPGLI